MAAGSMSMCKVQVPSAATPFFFPSRQQRADGRVKEGSGEGMPVRGLTARTDSRRGNRGSGFGLSLAALPAKRLVVARWRTVRREV